MHRSSRIHIAKPGCRGEIHRILHTRPGGKAYNNYSISLESGETGTVYINVVNREQKPVEYLLKVFLGNETVQEKEFLLAEQTGL